MKPLSIGQLARRAGVGVETVRYYERQGLLAEPARKGSGYRQYGAEVVAHLRFIRRAKGLGFSLREIGELLALRLEPTASCADVKRRARAKLDDIEGKIRDLQRIQQALAHLTASCKGRGPLDGCSILAALESERDARDP